MNKIFSFAVIALAFTSCQNSTESDALTADSITMSAPAAATATESNNLDAIATSPATTVTTPAGNNAGGLNPEHGKPGHRCDIAVGAPLNSPAGNSAPAISSPLRDAAPGLMQAPAPVMTQAPAPTSGSGKRLNPAHGAPGHDCSVPVGQPLKG